MTDLLGNCRAGSSTSVPRRNQDHVSGADVHVQNSRVVVSAILAAYNEAAFIDKTLQSICNQLTPDFDLEILVVDGGSQDGTIQKVEQFAEKDRRIKVLRNPHREIPHAWNIGLRASRGEYVCILGAHNTYKEDYISVCLRELRQHDAVGCSGRAITKPVREDLQAQLCAWALAHSFGSSTRSFRTQPEGFVDSPAFPVLVKEAVLSAGGYNEVLSRNEDNDLSQRLRAAGGKLFCTWKTNCYYHGKSTIRELLRYAFRNGWWNSVSLRINLRSMGLRHFVPLLFVLALGGLLVAGTFAMLVGSAQSTWILGTALGILVIHLLLGSLASLQIGLQVKCLKVVFLPWVFFLFHFSYGLGTLCGLFRAHQRFRDEFALESIRWGKQS